MLINCERSVSGVLAGGSLFPDGQPHECIDWYTVPVCTKSIKWRTRCLIQIWKLCVVDRRVPVLCFTSSAGYNVSTYNGY